MLQQLVIQNVATIEKVIINFEEGLNILTGETGAGKSIVIDSINSILGGRISKDIIRHGKDKAVVEGCFIIQEQKIKDIMLKYGIEIEEDNTVIIQREIAVNGKSSNRINGRLATLSILKEFGEHLIDIHGQHDNQTLFRVESHIELLDLFSGEKTANLKKTYSEILHNYNQLNKKLSEIIHSSIERERRIDLLKYQIDEIKNANLKVDEDIELERQRKIATESEKIKTIFSDSYETLYEGKDGQTPVIDSINEVIKSFLEISSFDKKYEDILKSIKEAYYTIEDVVGEIRDQRDNIEFDMEQLQTIEERLDVIIKLKRKYGKSISVILEYLNSIEEELDKNENSQVYIEKLKKEIFVIEKDLYQTAKELNKNRVSSALVIEEQIAKSLYELEMKNCKLKVSISFQDDENNRKYNKNGLDKIEFLISTNLGEPLKPLSKIASGGEISRIMLAIKTILADVDEIPTLIFDEIDTGISGIAAGKVGNKLVHISKKRQVLCVTHLAQIACMANNHLLIEKKLENNETKTRVSSLNEENVTNEIARILGGSNISDITLKHAEEMLKNRYNNL